MSKHRRHTLSVEFANQATPGFNFDLRFCRKTLPNKGRIGYSIRPDGTNICVHVPYDGAADPNNGYRWLKTELCSQVFKASNEPKAVGFFTFDDGITTAEGSIFKWECEDHPDMRCTAGKPECIIVGMAYWLDREDCSDHPNSHPLFRYNVRCAFF